MLTSYQMSTLNEGRSKQIRKMSKKQRCALGLASESESNSESHSESSEDDSMEADKSEEDTPVTVHTPASTLPQSHTSVHAMGLTLPHSQSTTSVVSHVSAPICQVNDTEEKHAKFNERFKTATSTDKEVLCSLLSF